MTWVQTFEPSGWASFLSHLNPYDNTLLPGHVVDRGLIVGSFVAPGVLLVLGIVCAFIVLARICCCEPTRKENRGKSMCPSLTFATLAFVLTGIGLFFFLGTAKAGYNQAMDTISDAYIDTKQASDLAINANSTGTDLLSELDELKTSCSALGSQIDPLKVQVEEYMALLVTFSGIIEPIPPQLERLENGEAEKWQNIFLAILGVPIILVVAICLIMVFAVVGTACCIKAGSCCAKCEDFCLFRLGSLGIAATILFVSAISTLELGVGIGLSDFCGSADHNVLTVVNSTFGPGTTWYNDNGNYLADAAVYYINGTGSNPMLDELAMANTSLNEVAVALDTLKQFAQNPVIAAACPGDELVSVTAQLNASLVKARSELNECDRLLQPDVVYPYYQEVVHKELCSVVIDGVAWLALFQFLTGLICLPCLACRAASFVHRRTFERARTLENDVLLAGDTQVMVLA